MEEWERKRLDEVYAKWEKRGRGQAQTDSLTHSASPVRSRRRPLATRAPRRPVGSRPHYRGRRQHRLSPDSILAPLTGFVPSLGIDSTALHSATSMKYTSISRCCQKCVPFSRNKFYPDVKTACGVGLQNFLLVDKRKYRGFPGRLFPYLSHVYSTPIDYTMADLRPVILHSQRVRDAIELCANAAVEHDGVEYGQAVREQEKRAATIVSGMSAGLYKTLVRAAGWMLSWVFGKLFNHIHVQKKHILMLKRAQERGVPIVFLPGHKSHMDYLIMTFILFNMGIRIPRIAAGDNLKLPMVSWLVTHLGGYFIKRKLDPSGGKDVLYRKCLHQYMEEALHSGENMEFFIEGSRSRSGKPSLPPKAGLLSVLVDSVKEGVTEDILIVPVSISYDKLLESGFIQHELMGGSKKPETFLEAMRGAWSMMTENTGGVRVDFSQPFSLQEYISSASVTSRSLLEMSNIGRCNSMANLADYEQRKLVTALSHHIVYDFSHCASLMSTNMVAFLLLNKHRKGVKYSELVSSYEWLERMAITHGRAVAFTGEPHEAVHYALHYLGPLVQLEAGRKRNGLIEETESLYPSLALPEVFQLLHHGNQATPVFALEAAPAVSTL